MSRWLLIPVFLIVFLLTHIWLFAAPVQETKSNAATTESASASATDYFPNKVEIEYSRAFEVQYFPSYKIVTVSRPWPGAESGVTYLLVQRGTQPPAAVSADKTFEIPVRSIVTMSTSYLPCLEELDVLDTLVGHENFAWVYSKAVNERIATGAVREVGSGPTVNVELLLDLDPDLIMAYGMGNEWDTHPKLEEAGLPYVINAEWNETTPLSRAEWIKYVAVFYNREAEANAYFHSVVEEYTSLSEIAAGTEKKPTVFSGAPYQGTWWMPGGGSFAARFFKDSGAAYVWADDDSTGGLMLDVETVYERAGDAEYWLNTGYWNTLDDAKSADERFGEFKAYKTGMIYNNNERMSPGGGNDYYESGPINPQKVLADLIKIFHPELLPGHELYYYKKLN